MNWNEVFEYKEDGFLYWKESELKRSHFRNISPDRKAGCVGKGKNNKAFYIEIRYLDKIHRAHKIVWEMHNGKIPNGMQIDHIDGNGTNNKLENLRLVTCAENLKNKSRYANNTSGCVGVSWHKAQKKWMAYISDAGKRITIGYYKVLDDAITARKDAERVYGYHENHGR